MTIPLPLILAALVAAIFMGAWATAEQEAHAQDVTAQIVAEVEHE